MTRKEVMAALDGRLRDLTEGGGASVEVEGHEVMIVRAGDAATSKQPHYIVACMTCHALLHEHTADVAGRIDRHLRA
jgi:hypothetical protein